MSVRTEPCYYLATMPADMDGLTVQRRAGDVLGEPLEEDVSHQHGITWSYRVAGALDVTLEVSVSRSLPRQMLVKIDEMQWAALGPERLADLLFALSLRADVILARTTSLEDTAVVLDDELDGDVKGLHWFQFLSPRIAARWAADNVMRGPFSRVLTDGSGAVGLVLPGTPFLVKGRRAAAQYLGIQLRPIYGRNPVTGERIVIPYTD